MAPGSSNTLSGSDAPRHVEARKHNVVRCLTLVLMPIRRPPRSRPVMISRRWDTPVRTVRDPDSETEPRYDARFLKRRA